MKAVRVNQFGGPDVLKAEDIAEPRPQAGQVLIQVKAAGVNPVDTYIRSGSYPLKPEMPYTPGFDAAGIVEAVGGGVKRFKPGDHVYTSGTVSGAYAQKAVCLESQVYPLPVELNFSQGACVGIPYVTAYQSLFHKAHAVSGETVLVHGATGGVGIAAVQIARASGLKVFATGGTDEGRKLIRREGAHFAFDHTAADYQKTIMEAAEDKGLDVILEMLANVNLEKDLAMLAFRGRVVVIGCRGSVEINPRQMMARDTSILGMTLFNATEKEKERTHAALAVGFKNGTLKPVVGKELPLEKASEAHRKIIEGPASGKWILIP